MTDDDVVDSSLGRHVRAPAKARAFLND
jgi:hypothetical protein